MISEYIQSNLKEEDWRERRPGQYWPGLMAAEFRWQVRVVLLYKAIYMYVQDSP